jgi:hypothetical protein
VVKKYLQDFTYTHVKLECFPEEYSELSREKGEMSSSKKDFPRLALYEIRMVRYDVPLALIRDEFGPAMRYR